MNNTLCALISFALTAFSCIGGEDALPPISDLGDVCQETAEAWCDRAIECGSTDLTREACISSYFDGCCYIQGTCSGKTTATPEWVGECKLALGDYSCRLLELDNMPPECLSN